MIHGEIRWFKFSYPDKKRPVLILTRSSIIKLLSKVTVAPITSTILGIPSEVNLTIDDGMNKNCVINLDNIQTVDKSQIGGYITTLNFSKLKQVTNAIRFALDL